MKNNFKYLIKESIPLATIITIIMTLIHGLFSLTMDCKYNSDAPVQYLVYPTPLNVIVIIVLLVIIVTIMPIITFARFKRKDFADVYFALPLSKKEIFLGKILCGFLVILFSFTISYFMGFFILLVRGADFYMASYITLYFILILSIIPLYLISTFFVLKANTVLDSVFFVGLYCIISSVIISAILILIFSSSYAYKFDEYYFYISPYFSFSKIYDFFGSLLLKGMPNYSISSDAYNESLKMMFLSLGIQYIIGVLATVGIIFTIIHYKNEDIEERSTSWFGYKTLIPILFAICLISVFSIYDIASTALSYAIFIVAYIVLTMVLEFRSFKIPKSRYITLIIILVSVTTFSFIRDNYDLPKLLFEGMLR